MENKATLVSLKKHLKKLNQNLDQSQVIFQTLSDVYKENLEILQQVKKYE